MCSVKFLMRLPISVLPSSVWNKAGDLSFLHWRVVWAELGFVEVPGETFRDR